MAFIENRRTKRKLMLAAVIAGGTLVVCGLIALMVLVAVKPDAEPDPAPTHTPNLDTEAPTTEPTLEPTAEPTPYAEATVSPVPEQTWTERPNVLLDIELIADDGRQTVNGRMYVDFVNNADVDMYYAMFEVGALSIDNVTIDGRAARFTVSDDGMLMLPFVDILDTQEHIDIFFEFSASAEHGTSLPIPVPAYDTVFDMTAYVRSATELGFSVSPTTVIETDVHVYCFMLEGIKNFELRI